VAQADGDAVAEHNIERDGGHSRLSASAMEPSVVREHRVEAGAQALAFVASNDDNGEGTGSINGEVWLKAVCIAGF